MTTPSVFTRSAPEAQGVSSAAIRAFVEAVDAEVDDLHSVLLLRHGRTVAQGWWAPFAPHRPHMLFSVSKSFVATAVGLAISEGRLSLDSRVADLLSDDLPDGPRAPELAALTVRHLLTMTTGHDPATVLFADPDGNWARGFLAQPFVAPPGERFCYENGATYALSALVEQVTGQTTLDYLRPRLFEPLGIESPTWATCPRGRTIGFTGLNLTTEQLARFGQLHLQRGLWNGARVLPEAWVDEATRWQTDTDQNDEGYGYQFWRAAHNSHLAAGAFGQYAIVLPDQDAVLVTTGGKENMRCIRELFWEHALPGFADGPLPADSAAARGLAGTLAGLSLRPPYGGPVSPRSSGGCYAFSTPPLTFDFGAGPFSYELRETSVERDACTLTDSRGTHRIAFAAGAWLPGTTTFNSEDGRTERPIAAAGAWTDDDTFVLDVCFVETAFRTTLTFRFFYGGTVHLTWRERASFGYPWHEESPLGYEGPPVLVGAVTKL